MEWYRWVLIITVALLVIVIIFVFLAVKTSRNESNCDRLRRLGERGFYNDESNK